MNTEENSQEAQASPSSGENSIPLWGAATDIGRVRKENQDAFVGLPEIGLFLVSDGMGGAPGGKLAADIVIGVLPKMLKARLRRFRNPRPRAIRYWLKYEILKLSRNVLARSASEPGLKGMGATLVLVLCQCNRLHIAHMGDSRAYLFRNRSLVQLTDDHSVVGFLLRQGEITQSETEQHPARGTLTRCIGMQADVKADVKTVAPKKGDRILLCSDGLHGMVSENEISAILDANPNPGEACQALIDAANKVGGKDNITAVMVDWAECPASTALPHALHQE